MTFFEITFLYNINCLLCYVCMANKAIVCVCRVCALTFTQCMDPATRSPSSAELKNMAIKSEFSCKTIAFKYTVYTPVFIVIICA